MQKIVKERKNIVNYVVKSIAKISFSAELWQQVADKMGLDQSRVVMLFPGGLKQLIAEIEISLDHDAKDKIIKYLLVNPNAKIREKVGYGVVARLFLDDSSNFLVQKKILEFYKSLHNIDVYLKHLWHVADLIWRSIGDKATDSNYYSKRMILSIVYRSTWNFCVNDQSKDFRDTLWHLDQVINKIMRITAVKAQYGSWANIKNKIPFIRFMK